MELSQAAGEPQVVAPNSQTPAGNDPNPPAEPTVLEVDDTTLIKPKGFEKPVKYGEHVRGLQSEFTKAKQREAQIRQELEQERQLRQRYEYERQQALARERQAGQPDPYESLRQLPYLSGEDAVNVVQSIGQQLQFRDRVITVLAQELKAIKDQLGGITTSNAESAFDARINQFLQENDYPPEFADLAKEIYLAYEGDDVWSEFPQIFRQRYEQIQRGIEARRQAALARNRQRAFVPGKGGTAGPSQPIQMKGNEDPREVADQIWEYLHGTKT